MIYKDIAGSPVRQPVPPHASVPSCDARYPCPWRAVRCRTSGTDSRHRTRLAFWYDCARRACRRSVTCRTIHHCLGCRGPTWVPDLQPMAVPSPLRSGWHTGTGTPAASPPCAVRERLWLDTRTLGGMRGVCPAACPACVLRVSTLHLVTGLPYPPQPGGVIARRLGLERVRCGCGQCRAGGSWRP